jgi:hypothetical protein
MAKLKRFIKGSKEAKRYMARIRGVRSGRLRRRKGTYRNGLVRGRKHSHSSHRGKRVSFMAHGKRVSFRARR